MYRMVCRGAPAPFFPVQVDSLSPTLLNSYSLSAILGLDWWLPHLYLKPASYLLTSIMLYHSVITVQYLRIMLFTQPGLSLGSGIPTASTEKEAAAKRGSVGQKEVPQAEF